MKKTISITLFILLASQLLIAQTITVNEINPTQSTLDNTDPDGSSGGRVNKLGITSDGTVMYAASEWGGLYRSNDGGLNWVGLENHIPQATWDVEVSPTNNNLVFATSFYDGRVNSLSGLNVSTNGGNTWRKPASFNPPLNFCANANRRNELSGFGIAIDPQNNNNIYVGTSCGLAISNDGGNTWNFIDPTPGDGADNIWDIVVHNGIIDLIGDDGHQRSTDGGTTWTSAAPANSLPGGISSIDVSPDEDYVLFATVGTRIFQTVDGGLNWTSITNPSPQGRIPFVRVNDRGGNNFDLWFGDVGLHRCGCTTPNNPTQGGAARCPANNWSASFTRSNGGHDDCSDIIFDPTVNQNACPLIFSSDGGVYFNTLNASPNCQTPQWEQPNTTVRSLWLFGMGGADFEESEAIYFGNQDNGTFSTTNGTDNPPNWNNRECCDGFDIAPNQDNILYTVCCFGGRANRLFLRDSDMTGGGEIPNYPAGNIRGFTDIDVVRTVSGNDVVLVTSSGVFFTNNINSNPITWNQLGAGSTPGNIAGVKTSIDNAGNVVFYIQTGGGNGRSRDGLWRYNGTGTGGTWTIINTPNSQGGFGIFDVHPSDPNLLIASHLQAGSNPNMILSTDGGTNWTTLTNLNTLMTGNNTFQYQNNIGPTNFTGFLGYPQPSLVAFNPFDEDFIVAGGADSGVFLSTDGGTNWRLITDPIFSNNALPHIPRPKFAHFEDASTDNLEKYNVYIGTKGRGVWRISVTLSITEDCLSFNPNNVRAQQDGNGYLVTDGNSRMMTFRNRSDADQAVRVIKAYGMNKHCFALRPNPALRYFLINNELPEGRIAGEDCIRINDRNNLSIRKNSETSFSIIDGNHIIWDAKSRAEAETIIEIVKKHEADYTCYIGRPDPGMAYLRKSGPPVELPEDCLSFNPNNVRAQQDGSGYLVTDGNSRMMTFRNRSDADQAVRVIKAYGMNKHCFALRPNPALRYFLINNELPEGRIAGEDCIRINDRNNLSIRKNSETSFSIIDGNHIIWDAKSRAEAETIIEIVKKHEADYTCYIGRPDPGMAYLRKSGPPVELPEDCLSFNPNNVRAQQDGSGYLVTDGNSRMMTFRNRSDADQAVRVIKAYGMNKHCFALRPNPALRYFLINNELPEGRIAGEDCIRINDRDNLSIRRNSETSFSIIDGNHIIWDAKSRAEAETIIEIVKAYEANFTCYVGRPNPGMAYLRN